MALQQSIATEPAPLNDLIVHELRTRLSGALVLPRDPDYDAVRSIFNAMIDRRPAAIARCADTNDVVAALDFARRHGLVVSVRGGGHNVAGHSVCDGGLMIDLSLMKVIEVDPERRIATAQAGLTLGELILATERYGLVTPTGTASDTGMAGLRLGAGFGWLSGKYGFAIDNLVGAEVVTADGQVLHASESEHPDLFWALRGGSGNFGIVTSFELKLHPLRQVLGGKLMYPFARAAEVLRYYREVSAASPDELTHYAGLVTAPTGEQVVAVITCWCGNIEEGERALAPIRAFGPPLLDDIQPMPYSTMNTLFDDFIASGRRNYWKTSMLRELSDGAIDTIVEHVARVPSPKTAVLIGNQHGAARRVPPTATAFPHRDAPYTLAILSIREDLAVDAPNIQWTRDLAAAARPFSTGFYVNDSWDETPRAALGVNYDRLVEMKSRYDPTNFFRHNTNIAPTGDA